MKYTQEIVPLHTRISSAGWTIGLLVVLSDFHDLYSIMCLCPSFHSVSHGYDSNIGILIFLNILFLYSF
jgi:hypothetical protein